jgi:iron transport multicopper oxidase
MISSVYRFVVLAVIALLPNFVYAETVTYDLDIGWVLASPDGFVRPVIGVNNQWPPPVLYATVGDQIVVNVKNNLGNATTAIHFHGMFQNGTTNMDGAAGVTQCDIPTGQSMTYNFTVCCIYVFNYESNKIGQSTWYLLVSFSCSYSVPGRSQSSIHHSGPQESTYREI